MLSSVYVFLFPFAYWGEKCNLKKEWKSDQNDQTWKNEKNDHNNQNVEHAEHVEHVFQFGIEET